MIANRFTRMIAVGSAVLGAGLTVALPASAATRRSHHHASHHHASHHHASHHHASHGSRQAGIPIPQHNGGDRDADNNGGPSDGDGNV
jgi:hypothetical protein